MSKDEKDKSMFWDATVGVAVLFFMWQVLKIKLGISYVCVGPLLSHWQDLDYFVEKMRNGSVWREKCGFHRTWTHAPLINILAAAMLWILFRSLTFVLFFASLAFWHLFHDSMTSWGIPWFGPFSWRYRKIYHRGQWLVSWSPQEVDANLQRRDEPWEQRYFRFHSRNVLHLMVLLPFYLVLLYQAIFR